MSPRMQRSLTWFCTGGYVLSAVIIFFERMAARRDRKAHGA